MKSTLHLRSLGVSHHSLRFNHSLFHFSGGKIPRSNICDFNCKRFRCIRDFSNRVECDDNDGGRRKSSPIYVAATQEHVGKTTTCLALVSGLQKRFPKTIGYVKPVGQKHVLVHSNILNSDIRVDKDVALIRELFNLQHIDFKHMSPVLIPSGYTKDYIDGKISHEEQLSAISDAVQNVTEYSDVLLCEGTGHCGVGSIVDASNARVAGFVGASMILIANGGLGSSFDQLELNRVLCESHNVKVAGVIINKVLPEKYEQTKDYMSRALQKKGIPLLGCIPDNKYLGSPALADLERLFQTKLINGEKHRFRHYSIRDFNLVTTSMTHFLSNLRNNPSRTLYLCHVTRDDIIIGFIGEFLRRKRLKDSEPFEGALIVCGREGKYSLSTQIRELCTSQDDDVPVLYCPHTTEYAIESMKSMTPKLNIYDKERVKAAINHYEKYIDYELLLSVTGNKVLMTP